MRTLLDVVKEKSGTYDNLDDETRERMKQNLIALFTKYSSFEENNETEHEKENKD